MSRDEKAKITQLYAVTAAYFRQQLPDEVLKLYAEDLAELNYDDAYRALNAYRKDPKNRTVPLPSQIISICTPAVDPLAYGREVAGRIVKAISLYGWPQPAKAREFIGEEGWQVIQERGGWEHFCGQHGVDIDPGQFAAQARDRVADQVQCFGIKPKVMEIAAPQKTQLEESKKPGLVRAKDAWLMDVFGKKKDEEIVSPEPA